MCTNLQLNFFHSNNSFLNISSLMRAKFLFCAFKPLHFPHSIADSVLFLSDDLSVFFTSPLTASMPVVSSKSWLGVNV